MDLTWHSVSTFSSTRSRNSAVAAPVYSVGPAAPASILAPQNNGGLLHSGAEDIVGMGGNSARQVNLLRADEGLGAPRSADPQMQGPPAPLIGEPPIVGHETPPPGPSTVVGPAGAPTSPTASPQYKPTPPAGGESSAPLMKPYQAPAPTAAPAVAAPPAAAGGSAAPGATPTSRLPGQSGLDKIGEMGKALGGVGGAQAGKSAGFAPGGVGAPNSPNGSALMAEVLKYSQPSAGAGPVPGMPQGLLQRFRR
jgi:hypothetical protein